MVHTTGWITILLSLVTAALLLPACGGGSAEIDTATLETAAATDEDEPSAKSVAKIVFVDQEEACDCTRARIDATWSTLQLALEGREGTPVERIHSDTQELQARPYLDMRPLMVAPGLYFLDADGGLVEQLQGELTEGQIGALLPAPPAPAPPPPPA